MTNLKTLARAVGLGLCVAALSGSALADPGQGNGNGPESTPPGQEKKAETPAATAPAPAPQAAQGQEQKAENQAKQAAKKAAPKPTAKSKGKSTAAKAAAPGQAKKAEKQAEKSDRKADKGSKGQSANAHHHVIVCHRTGSESNPYVVINIPFTAWTNAHSPTTGSHPDKNGRHDILLKDPASGPGTKDGFDKSDCESAAGVAPLTPVTPQQKKDEKKQACPQTTTTTERVLVGVWHATGAVKDGQRKFVFITPSLNSAHYDKSKHEDDIPVYEERTVSVTASAESCKAATPPTQNVTPTANVQQPQPVVPTAAGQPLAPGTVGVLPVGEVAGAVSPAPTAEQADKPAGGVLGAIASAPEAVAETAVSGELPFTGIPLWIAALIGGALLATGLVLRRSTS